MPSRSSPTKGCSKARSAGVPLVCANLTRFHDGAPAFESHRIVTSGGFKVGVFGLSAALETFTFTGTSNTPKLQHSADDGVTDAYADITGAAFAAITAAPNAQLIETATNLTIRRYIRLVSVGTFNPSTFACAVMRHLTSTI